ncbi:MAG TPA: hypothetical protein VGF82_25880 [Terracidiphilus sp.]
MIDPRLLPLIETLIAADADWLAFEILDGISFGRVVEETREDLQSTRLAVRTAKHQRRRSEERAVPPPAATPLVGDEQIDWAAKHIADRLSDAVSMLGVTLDRLNQIVSSTEESQATTSDRTSTREVDLVMREEGEGPVLRSAQVDDANAAIPKLREALSNWANSTKIGGHSA